MSLFGLEYTTPLSIKSVRREFVTEGINLTRNVIRSDGQKWEITVGLKTAGPSDKGAALHSVHQAKHGGTQAFSMLMPQHVFVERNFLQNMSMSVSGAKVAGNNTVNVNQTYSDDALVGRFISFTGKKKVYQIESVVENVSITIYPNLVDDIADSTVIDLTPNIDVYYIDTFDGTTYEDGILARIIISVREK